MLEDFGFNSFADPSMNASLNSAGIFSVGGGGGYGPYDPTFTQVGGSVSIPQAPNPADVVGGWGINLKDVTGVTNAISGIYTARENAARAAEDRSFSQFARSAELDLKRAQVSGQSELGKLTLAAQLAKARAALTPTSPSAYVGLVLVVALAWVMFGHKLK